MTQGQQKLLVAALTDRHLPRPAFEYTFAPPRKWRFDVAWPAYKLALEVEGGVWVHGRHTRGNGYSRDMQKYSEAAVQGWCILRVSPAELVTNGLTFIARAFAIRGVTT